MAEAMIWDAEIELAWAAGFFDGEGSSMVHQKGIRLRVSQAERQPLERFRRAVKGGRIYGPYTVKNPRAKPQYEWVARRAEAERIIDDLLPYLSDPKRDQLSAVRAVLA